MPTPLASKRSRAKTIDETPNDKGNNNKPAQKKRAGEKKKKKAKVSGRSGPMKWKSYFWSISWMLRMHTLKSCQNFDNILVCQFRNHNVHRNWIISNEFGKRGRHI
jgi:hypothetical protein